MDTIFSDSSVLTPFALGAAIGAIATGRVPVGNATGPLFSSWLDPTSVFIGALAVANSAYSAAVYLTADAARLGERPLERAFRRQALGAGVVVGAVALGGIVVVNSDNHRLFHALLTGYALAAVIVSLLAGVTTLALVWRRRFDTARFGAAVAVAVDHRRLGARPLAYHPPGSHHRRRGVGTRHARLDPPVGVGGRRVHLPLLGLLFGLTLTGGFERDERTTFGGIARRATFGARWDTRAAVSCFIAGIGLLTFADAAWAHGIGVVCLLGFIVVAFLAIVPPALADQAEIVPADASGRFFPSRFRQPGDGGSGDLR